MISSRPLRFTARVALALLVAGTMLATPIVAFADSSHPAITEARAAGGILSILGLNLGGDKPKVILGTLPLSVVSMTATQIDALIPAGVAPGSYLLTVMLGKGKSDDNEGKYDEFWVTIGATGAAGKDGATGPQGPVGPMGATGSPGTAGAGAALPNIHALEGLACNVSSNMCKGTTRLKLKDSPSGSGIGLEWTCQSSEPEALLTLEVDTTTSYGTIAPFGWGQELNVSTPFQGVGGIFYANAYAIRKYVRCAGEVIVVRFTLGVAHTGRSSSMTVTAGSCGGVMLHPNESVECTVTMSGAQWMAARSSN